MLAAGAGLILAMRVGTAAPDDGFTLLGVAAAAAFLGGTSAYGRRGGVFGTALAAGFLQLAALWLRAGRGASRGPDRRCLVARSCSACWSGGWSRRPGRSSRRRWTRPEDDSGPETQLWDPYGTGSFARPSTDPYPTGGFTPAASFREGAEPYWPGQAPAPEDEPTTSGPTRDLSAYREPGRGAER